ncbi:DUF1269 domain-containing protein [Tabrizicola sp.]|uniref:DUF1269 domain-containing protein n=1 Tax=Tabrizicola sp. TaxID=2005166 RepID=UPI002734B7DF|nr:DUF1269 domain-containing protein [Tabrizicola sp.]MDP3197351.1 DUF1269 domain-containing protein [Tabrizicola sp.]
MSDLIIAAYPSPTAAFVAGEGLASLQQEAGVEPEDIVVVTRTAAGRVSLNQSIDLATGKPLGGGRWAALIGMLFLDDRKPSGSGRGLAEQLLAAGLDAGFLNEVSRSLTTGGAALGIHVRLLGVDRVRARLAELKGHPTVLHARLTAETEEALHDLQAQIPSSVLNQPDGLI